MAFRRDKQREAPAEGDGAELVIDAELADPAEPTADILPVPRSAALPEAREVRALDARRESDLAMRNVAVATAGGVVAGAATIVLVRAAQKIAKPAPGLARRRRKDVVASRSFMVDVHMLKSDR